MTIVTKALVKLKKFEFRDRIRNGDVFIHPTDTIYGIGCNANDSLAVARIRQLKNRFKSPFSVIAPSKEWIHENCELSEEEKVWVEKLPGPYTLILKLKNKDCIANKTNLGLDTLGVRIPDHWFSELVGFAGVPVVTTSANRSGMDFMTRIENLEPEIKRTMDFMIYEGEKKGAPSTLINLTEDQEVVIKR